MADNDGSVVLEDVRIIFRNFAGKEGQYNREGDRNFGVVLPSREVAEQMLADGWNVKYLSAREDEDEEEDTPWIQVTVGVKGRPPTIATITSRGRTNITVEQSELLDWADIVKVDMILRPYHWDVQGKSGVKAYLKSIFVTIDEDDLERKYAQVDTQ